MIAILTVLSGGLGAVWRYRVDAMARRWWPTAFPGPTFVINVTGSVLIGLVAGLVIFSGAAPAWSTVIGTGFCGGYTTFSTAAVETIRAADGRGVRYAIATLIGSVAGCAVGLWLGWLM